MYMLNLSWLLHLLLFQCVPFLLCYEPEYPLDTSELSSEHSVRVLKPGIPNSRCVVPGDIVTALVRSFSPSVKRDISGVARQTFEAGKHSVTPLNQVVYNMCIDEIRRLGISFGNYGHLFYEVHVIDIRDR
ncbi:hypothetical protein BBOV_II003375 [Babesia bovis T2Bo]|uniref:hypothetical protein n=1 Tax=Babesia bovis T2Bo TaxID=484906 RepID=UPI001C3577BF|nr:hypothetical protein BBOV_II003375 [Babesia bovis T2Bo]KAG6440116.1 hypothetical protein BBOV_II003375 [Babesia bovis T2Bo]